MAEDERAKTEDMELLETVMDVRAVIEGAEEEGDLEGVWKENEGRVAESERVLGEAFGGDDLVKAKEECVRLRYWINIREAIEGWEKGKPVRVVH